MKKANETKRAGNALESRGGVARVADKGERARAQGSGQGTRGNGQGAAGGNAGSGKREAGRPLPSRARRFDLAERSRKDLAKPIEQLHYVEQLLDQYVDAKTQEDIDWVKDEISEALFDAVRAIPDLRLSL